MGAGASFDQMGGEDGGSGRRFFCHSCQRNMSYSGQEDTANLLCPYCTSSFIEEMPPASTELARVTRRRQDLQDLSSDQSRRLASAAVMLRLLEAQLHGEVQSLHDTLERRAAQTDEYATCMSPVMKKKLRKEVMDVDTVCSQPSCPICSEDFIVGEQQLCMPCAHFYHEACVVPWLDAKKTCPICRYELTSDIPTVVELEKFSEKDLQERYLAEVREEQKDKEKEPRVKQLEGDDELPVPKAAAAAPVAPSGGKHDVASQLHEVMVRRKLRADEKMQEANRSTLTLPARSGLTQSFMREIFGGDRDPTELEQEALGEGRMRTQAERAAAPSFSNRTLRQIINEAEEEERQREAARHRIAALVAGQNAAFGESIIPVPGGGGGDSSGADIMSALLSNQARRIFAPDTRGILAGENEDEAGEVEPTPTPDPHPDGHALNSSAPRPFGLGNVSTVPSLMPMSSYLTSPVGTPTGRSITLGMPQTFVVRSSGDGEPQLERRAALRQAMEEMFVPS